MTKHTLTLQNRELTAYLPARHRPDAPTLLVFPDSPAEADALAALLPDYIALLALGTRLHPMARAQAVC